MPVGATRPLQKQSTGLFLNSPLAEGFLRLVSLASQATKGAAFGIRQGLRPMHPAAFEKAGETFLLWTFTDSGNIKYGHETHPF